MRNVNRTLPSWPTLVALTVTAFAGTILPASAQAPRAARIGTIRSVPKPATLIIRGQTPDFEALNNSVLERSPTVVPPSPTLEPTVERTSWIEGPLPADPLERLGPIASPKRSTRLGRMTDALLNGTALPSFTLFEERPREIILSQFQTEAVLPQPVFATPPAYRWYGYGTTRPNLKQAPPTTEPSSEWYAQTGATPGAFPKPNAAIDDVEPPLATSQTVSPRRASGATSEREDAPLARRGETERQVLVETGQTADTVLPTASLQGIAPSVSIPVVPETTPEVTWTGIAAAEKFQPKKAISESIPINAPPVAEKPLTLPAAVEAATNGKATVESIEHEHARSIVIRLRAKTEADGQDAITTISTIPQLEPYRIRFELRLME